MKSTTPRSLKYLRDHGWEPWVTEHWVAIPGHPGGGVRRDLYNMFDIIAVPRDGSTRVPQRTIVVQTTSKSNMRARLKKMKENPTLLLCFAANWRVEIHGWYKEAGRWHVKVLNVGEVPAWT